MYLIAWCIAIFFGQNSNSLLQFEKALAQPLLKKLKVKINWRVYDGKNIPQVKLNFQHERDQKIEPLDDTIPQVVQPPVPFCISTIFTKSLLRSICCNQSYCQAGPPMNQFWASKEFTAKSWSLFIANSFFLTQKINLWILSKTLHQYFWPLQGKQYGPKYYTNVDFKHWAGTGTS